VKTSQLVDDLDGSIDDVESRYFGLDGRHYEIDLTKENWELLLAELEPFVKKGREISTRKIRALYHLPFSTNTGLLASSPL
jgi:hypothetical protein